MTWHAGDAVRITYEGRTVDGAVVLASSNGRSLVLEFEALLGGYVGTMPVLWRPERRGYTDLLQGKPVQVDAPDARA